MSLGNNAEREDAMETPIMERSVWRKQLLKDLLLPLHGMYLVSKSYLCLLQFPKSKSVLGVIFGVTSAISCHFWHSDIIRICMVIP